MKVDSERWTTLANTDLNWGYQTLPQKHAKGRTIDYSRGKGLGGSSAINFGCYDIGPKDDFEEWAKLVGDDTWRWDRSLQRYKSLETYHAEVPPHLEKYLKPDPAHHGDKGFLDIGFPSTWERDLPKSLEMFEAYGIPLNPDLNSGYTLGMGLCPNSAYKGRRTTSGDLLNNAPSNLNILTDTIVDKVIVRDEIAVGVEAGGNQYFASKEVILSAGSLDTPKILMLSGIGPREELQKHGITLLHELPRIGKGLRDHYGFILQYLVKDEYNDRGKFYRDPERIKVAKEQRMKDGTGELATFACAVGMGFFKSDKIYNSKEFQALSQSTQTFLQKSTIPYFEIIYVSHQVSLELAVRRLTSTSEWSDRCQCAATARRHRCKLLRPHSKPAIRGRSHAEILQPPRRRDSRPSYSRTSLRPQSLHRGREDDAGHNPDERFQGRHRRALGSTEIEL